MDVNGGPSSVDELLERAIAAINRGDRHTATSMAEQVLTTDRGNAYAEDLLAAIGEPVPAVGDRGEARHQIDTELGRCDEPR